MIVFWKTPLSALALSNVDAVPSAALQAALAAGLTRTGSGTHDSPNPATDRGTILFGQGPIATVHFNTHGFPVVDSSAILGALIMALIAGVLIAAALRIVGGKVFAFRDRAQVALLFALAITFYVDLGQPVFNRYGYGYFVYSVLAGFIGCALAGLAIARWFPPNARSEAERSLQGVFSVRPAEGLYNTSTDSSWRTGHEDQIRDRRRSRCHRRPGGHDHAGRCAALRRRLLPADQRLLPQRAPQL